jgi:hypothetical protein
MPFSMIDTSDSENTFLVAQCHFDIKWKTPEVDDEELEYSFEDLFLTTDSSDKVLPIGNATMDMRNSLGSRPKYVSLDAREQWKHTQLRFTAIFLVKKSDSNFSINFAGKEYPTTLTQSITPNRSEYAQHEVTNAQLITADKLFTARATEDIPGSKLKLSNDYGNLLAVTVKTTPVLPNVLGGELRYIYRPSDFQLKHEDQVIQPVGFLNDDGRFMTDSIYNISRTDLKEFQKTFFEISAVFAVGKDFKKGKLLFLNHEAAEVTLSE